MSDLGKALDTASTVVGLAERVAALLPEPRPDMRAVRLRARARRVAARADRAVSARRAARLRDKAERLEALASALTG